MKQIFTLITCLLIVGASRGQNTPISVSGSTGLSATGIMPSPNKTHGLIDTLNQYVTRATGFTIFNAQSGYIFGTGSDGANVFSDATAMYFDSIGPVDVLGVYTWVARKEIIGSPDLIKAELWEAGADSLPTILKAFGNASMAFIDTSSNVNFNTLAGLSYFQLNQGTPSIDGDFLVGINYAGIDDTLGIVSSVQGDGLMESRAKQLTGIFLGGSWAPVSAIWTIQTAPMDVDVIIYAIVEHTAVNVEDRVFTQKGLKVWAAYPCPAISQTHIRFTLEQPNPVRIFVFNEEGKIFYNSPETGYEAGEHEFTLDVSNWPAGNYFYSVNTPLSNVSSRLVVVK